MHVGVKLADRSHRAMFEAASDSGLYNPEVDDPGSAYCQHVGGLDLDTQQWFTIAGGIQAAVANVELYLEEISLKQLRALVGVREEKTPAWNSLVTEWKKVDVDLADDGVKKARDLIVTVGTFDAEVRLPLARKAIEIERTINALTTV